MRKRILSILVALGVTVSVGPAQAIPIIGFAPGEQGVGLGTPVEVALTISGLGAFAAPSLSTFDLDVSFDPAILAFSSVTFGDPLLGDQLDLFGLGSITTVTPGTGVVNLFELSLDTPGDLDTLQPGSFTLATLEFDTLAVGTSPLGISINVLGNAFGEPLSAEVQGGSISPVPEPASFILMGIGLAGIAGLRRMRRPKNSGYGSR